MKTNQAQSDIKTIRSDTIWNEVKKHSEISDDSELIKRIPLSSIIRYMCHHTDDFMVCRDFTTSVKKLILNRTPSCVPDTVLEIYCDIAHNGYKDHDLENHLLDDISFRQNIPTLHKQYELFSPKQWKRVQLFEWHFSLEYPKAESISLEDNIKNKYEFLNMLRSMRKLSTSSEKQKKAVMDYNTQRRTCAELHNGIVIEAGSKHLP